MSMFTVMQWQPIHPALRPYEAPPKCVICKGETHTYDQLRKCVKAVNA